MNNILTKFEINVLINALEDSIARNDGAPLIFYKLLQKLEKMREYAK